MNISNFIHQYRNHPVLFVGTGISLRYLENSYTWNGLLSKIAVDLKGSDEYYLNLKARCRVDGRFRFDKIASLLEAEFNKELEDNRDGKFKEINDLFFEHMRAGQTYSRFKLYIAKIFESLEFRPEIDEEIKSFKKVRKNIASVITTNYDPLIESIYEFNKLIGNDILLSNPYGSVYKIHGCSAAPDKMIITEEDYKLFDKKYELIRAQLLSMFLHNPIIFLGYSVGDDNIKSLLKTIFTYVELNSEQADKIRSNFLLVEHDAGSDNLEVTDHDIDMEGLATIRINRIKTDNYTAIYESLADLQLPISALDIRKVQTIVKEIYSGGNISVKITEDLDSIKNSEKILAIGTDKTIQYQFLTISETITNYFKILDEANSQLLALVDKYKISSQQYFPIFGFSRVNTTLACANQLKRQQVEKLERAVENVPPQCKVTRHRVEDILNDAAISNTYKEPAILFNVWRGNITLQDVEQYLINHPQKLQSNFKKILCAYDCLKYRD